MERFPKHFPTRVRKEFPNLNSREIPPPLLRPGFPGFGEEGGGGIWLEGPLYFVWGIVFPDAGVRKRIHMRRSFGPVQKLSVQKLSAKKKTRSAGPSQNPRKSKELP